MYMYANKHVELAQQGIALQKIYVVLLLLFILGAETDEQIQKHKRSKKNADFIQRLQNRCEVLGVTPFSK